MIPTEGLSGPLQIGGKPLTYSKPIIGNGLDPKMPDGLQGLAPNLLV